MYTSDTNMTMHMRMHMRTGTARGDGGLGINPRVAGYVYGDHERKVQCIKKRLTYTTKEAPAGAGAE